MPGHVFVARADLTRLACDAVVVTCDQGLNIGRYWQGLLPPGLEERWGFLRLPVGLDADGVVRLPAVGDAQRPAFAIPVVGVRDLLTPASVVDAMSAGLAIVAAETRAANRARPLIATVLPGSRAGGLGGRRGEVIELYLPRLRAIADEHDVDLVLGVEDSRDVAAIQVRRSDVDFAAVPAPLRRIADRLGERASRGELSLFLGAGVSRSVGLPSWEGLIDALADEAGIDLRGADDDKLRRASALATLLGRDRYHAVLQEQLETVRYGLPHALLAGLLVRQAVTTNFDHCLENAMSAHHGVDGFRVLIRDLAHGDKPWLLKLHGDVGDPSSLTLTSEDYRRHPKRYRALHGVVQSLMLTSHLLFVGFGLADTNFLRMAGPASRARAGARRESEATSAGTALALTSSGLAPEVEDLRGDLDIEVMAHDGPSGDAAVVLEAMLDRITWRAAVSSSAASSYLLDDRFESALSPNDRRIRRALITLREEVMPLQESPARHQIDELLRAMGADDAAGDEGRAEVSDTAARQLRLWRSKHP